MIKIALSTDTMKESVKESFQNWKKEQKLNTYKVSLKIKEKSLENQMENKEINGRNV